MSIRMAVFLVSAAGLFLGCGSQAAPAAASQQLPARGPDTTVAHRDSVDLSGDVRRGPRFRVDSAGRLRPLPPGPTAAPDSGTGGCRPAADTAAARRSPGSGESPDAQ